MIVLSKKTKKSLLSFIVISLLLISSVFPGNKGIVLASSTTHAFDTGTGTLNIDYAGYLSKHDVVFNSPITTNTNGLVVANGRVGAQVWNANGLTMQVTGVDNSQQTGFSSGLVNLYTNPGMDTGYATFQERLNLYDGTVTAKYDSNRTVTIMGSPNSEVLGIHVDDSRTGVSSVILDLSIWDLSGLPSSSTSMYLDEPSMTPWKTVSTYNDSNGAGLSRGQTDANGFGYTLAASVEGANFTTSVVNGSMVRLTITPSSSYTIWIANATRKNAPNGDSVAQAKSLLTGVKSTGYATTLANFKNWWHSFWNSSFVQYSNSGDADYLENFYYVSQYIIAGGAFANYPFHHVNGAYSAVKDDDASQWCGGYWYWNERDVYAPFLASNHISVLDSFFNLYLRNYDVMKSHTQSRFGADGIWVPETIGWDGNARHTDESDYTKNIFSTGAEACHYMYMKYKYTNDSAWLNKIYPLMREVTKFYCSRLSYNSSTGKYYMASSNAHETYWNVKNALTDLAAIRAFFPMVIEASTILGQDSSLRSQWQNTLNNIQPYATDSNGFLPCDAPVPSTHNNENIACELAWPYDLIGIGHTDASKVIYNWNNRPFKYTEIWEPDAIQAARLGLGDSAYSSMKSMLSKFTNYPNGRYYHWNGNFEPNGTTAATINESLLQSYNDKIRVFPALPNDANFVSKFTLLAKGGFLVSSEKEANEIKYVGIKSLYGNTATIVNPWGTQQVQIRRASDNAIILTTSGSEFSFGTAANTVYVIERTAKLLSSYTYQQISGTSNQSQKTLSGTTCKLGSGTGPSVTSTPTPSTATATPTPSTSTSTPTPAPSTATATPTPTPTPSTATPTPTPTPTATSGSIKVQFFNGNTAATTNTIYPNFKVVNTGTSAINLSDVKMRYYFTNDGTQADSFACDYSTAGSGNVTGTFTIIAKTNADRYLEAGFTSAAGTLAAGGSAEVKGRVWKSDWSNFTQTGDYSFNATATNYVDAATVTGYVSGALIWGTEP